MQVRVDELLGVDLGPVDMLVRSQVEDDVRLRLSKLPLDPAGVADVAERIPNGRVGLSSAPVGSQGSFVGVEQRDGLRPETEQEGGQRPADGAAAAGEEDAPSAEPLLQVEERRHWISQAEHGLPVEVVRR